MFSVSDLKVSISSVQLSLFLDSKPNLCPKCGHTLYISPLAEVTLSSVVLLLGVGSIVFYKWISERNKKKSRLPFAFAKAIDNWTEEGTDENGLIGDISRQDMDYYEMLSSTPFLRSSQSLDFTQSIASSESSDLFNSLEANDDNESSLQKSSFKAIGNKTVAKLDELLEQIRDIKQSVSEIDEQIFDVKETNVKFSPKMFRLGPDMSSSITTETDLNDMFAAFSTEPQTPTLEWDSTDLTAMNSIINDRHIPSVGLNLADLSPNADSGDLLSNNIPDLESPQDLTSPSYSTSGEFSLASNPEPTKHSNSAAIDRIISEAKKSGLLKDLIDILIIQSKRDSAYFED